MKKEEFLKLIQNKLIVSCQASFGDALYGSDTMAKMGLAAKDGGAVAIRANGKADITAIKKATNLPIIGIVKKEYEDSDVYITPTVQEVKELIESNVEVITLDATLRKRPNNETLEDLITYIKENSNSLIMGDISTENEGIQAIEAGCDFISTTLSGYTKYSRQLEGMDFELIEELSIDNNLVVIAEGRVKTPNDIEKAIKSGAHSVVVGTAITRPQVLTKNFADRLTMLNVKV